MPLLAVFDPQITISGRYKETPAISVDKFTKSVTDLVVGHAVAGDSRKRNVILRFAAKIQASQGFALISLRDMGVEEVTDQESEWRRQWRQPRRKREQNSRFCGHNGLSSSGMEAIVRRCRNSKVSFGIALRLGAKGPNRFVLWLHFLDSVVSLSELP